MASSAVPLRATSREAVVRARFSVAFNTNSLIR
jgi:hypothetical protein